MFSAALVAIAVFAQGAAAAPPAGPPATPDPGHAVSGVTVTGKQALTDEQAANAVVCHDEPVLGSRFPKRVCATRRALDERKEGDKEVARDFQRSIITGAQPH
jgi:hypothetical protein